MKTNMLRISALMAVLLFVTLSACSKNEQVSIPAAGKTETVEKAAPAAVSEKPSVMDTKKNVVNPASDFTLMDLDGSPVSLSDFKGKVVLLNFWATWCPPCRHEIPDFIKMYDKYRETGLEIVGITLSSGSVADIKKFVADNGMNYHVLTGDENYLRQVAATYDNIRNIPTTFIIGRDGGIKQKWVGQISEKQAMDVINKHL